MNPQEFRPLFQRAARLLKERGWIRGNNSSPEGYCLIGALMFVFNEADKNVTNVYTESRVSWRRLLQVVEDRLGMRPSQWNDLHARSAEQVIDFLRSF